MTTVEVLKAARARIERGWCRSASARDNRGVILFDPGHPCATEWCARAAIMAERNPDDHKALRYVYDALPVMSLVLWNDDPGRTQADVLALYDKAIQLAAADTSRDAAGIAK